MFTVLFACTGNRCRSPYAHAYFARLVEDLPVEVISAGTLDAPGERVPSELVDIARSAGMNLADHRSQYLAPERFAEVDLFIGFERAHVAAAVVDAGIPSDKAFTLPELVRLLRSVDAPLPDDPIERARAAVAAAADKREEGPDFVPGEEVADPFRRSVELYERAAREITELCDALHIALFRGESHAAR
jgi:protein-tyrosine phosphatase